jgi:D-alanyl-D-alanine carboxypeptidase (penicillin-binding protein 5/6)
VAADRICIAQIKTNPRAMPEIKASSAILIDATTGQVLFEKNADVLRPPASTTKIMSAILLLEKTKPTDVISASAKAFDTEGSSLHLEAGEKVSAHDLLLAMMLRSANDGCVAAAEHIAGSEAKFAQMMTAKAREIGANHTTFRNCNGLNENPNVTTARDLAIMARYAQRYPEFNEATRTKVATIVRSTQSKDVVLKNLAKFLWKFPGADGIKTGYTNPAGHCFVGGATWGGWRLISVVLNSPDINGETARLMKFGFQTFERHKASTAGMVYANVPIKDGVRLEVRAAAKDAIQFVARKGDDLDISLKPQFFAVSAPVALGSEVGILEALNKDKVVGTTPLLATEQVEKAALINLGVTGAPSYWVLALAGTAVVGYGTAIAKTARRRGHRFKALLRGLNRRG